MALIELELNINLVLSFSEPAHSPTISTSANTEDTGMSFIGFSVGFCINREKGYLLPT